MDENTPIYNSRIFKNYLEYLEKAYPDLDIDSVLKYANMSIYSINEQGHWFTQQQADRFYEILAAKTNDPRIAREAGRYASSTEALGAIKQYMLGLVNLASVYMLMKKIYPTISKGAIIDSKKITHNKVEMTSIPPIGVNEKPYQCENRLGSFESLAKWFTNNYAKIEHPECFHKGDKCCRYIISWEETAAFFWKRFKNIAFLFGGLLFFMSLISLPLKFWAAFNLSLAISLLIIFVYASHLEKKELGNIIKNQGNAAKDLLDEINIRHENTILMHEIGQAISAIMDISSLTKILVSPEFYLCFVKQPTKILRNVVNRYFF